jgi:hypothetical protein
MQIFGFLVTSCAEILSLASCGAFWFYVTDIDPLFKAILVAGI